MGMGLGLLKLRRGLKQGWKRSAAQLGVSFVLVLLLVRISAHEGFGTLHRAWNVRPDGSLLGGFSSWTPDDPEHAARSGQQLLEAMREDALRNVYSVTPTESSPTEYLPEVRGDEKVTSENVLAPNFAQEDKNAELPEAAASVNAGGNIALAQQAAAGVKPVEETQDSKAAKVAGDETQVPDTQVTEELKLPGESKLVDEQQVTEEVKVPGESKLVDEKQVTEEVKVSEESKPVDEKPAAAEVKVAEESKLVDEAQVTEEVTVPGESKLVDEQQVTEEVTVPGESKLVDEQQVTEEVKLHEESQLVDEEPTAEEVKVLEESKLDEKQVTEEVKAPGESKLVDAKPVAEEVKVAEESKLVDEQQVTEEVKVPGESKLVDAKPVAEENKVAEEPKLVEEKQVTEQAMLGGDSKNVDGAPIVDKNSEQQVAEETNSKPQPAFDPIEELAVEWPDRDVLNHIANLETNDTGVQRIIVSAVSCNFLDMANNWLSSLESAGVFNYLIVALDDGAYDRLKAVRPYHVIASPFTAVSRNATYGSEGFAKVVRSRPVLLSHLLKSGMHFLYSDVDMFYHGNPFDELKPGFDVVGSTDSAFDQPPTPVTDADKKNICTGLLYVAPTNETFELMARWNTIMERTSRKLNQGAFNSALFAMGHLGKNPRIKVEVLDKEAFPPGFMFFESPRWHYLKQWQPTRMPVMVHNNFLQGTGLKIERFKEHGLWHPHTELSNCPAV